MGASNVIDEIAADLAKNAQMLRTDTADSLLKLLTDGTLTDEQLSELQGLFSNNLADDIAEPDYLLTIGGVGTFPRGDLQAIKGKAKNGKSFLCSILVSSILGCGKFGIKTSNPDSRVIYFDTEQSRANTAKLIRRIHALLGWNQNQDSARLLNYSMRTFTTEQRVQFIEAVTRKEQPQAIIIDGIADLITDFNNTEQSQNIVLELMKLSADIGCCCICVLHSAKTSPTGDMKGHLGSLLLQKASDCYEVKKSEDSVFEVEQTDSRNCPVDKFSFVIGEDALPELADDFIMRKAQERAEKAAQELRGLIEKAFATDKELTYTKLWQNIKTIIGQSERTAKSKVAEALRKNILEKDDNNNYYILPE